MFISNFQFQEYSVTGCDQSNCNGAEMDLTCNKTSGLEEYMEPLWDYDY